MRRRKTLSLRISRRLSEKATLRGKRVPETLRNQSSAT
jgi:hypothetical protein